MIQDENTVLQSVRGLIEKRLKSHGLKMSKQLSSGGLFMDPTYDNRIVYTFNDLDKLNNEGFLADQDIGVFLLNTFLG